MPSGRKNGHDAVPGASFAVPAKAGLGFPPAAGISPNGIDGAAPVEHDHTVGPPRPVGAVFRLADHLGWPARDGDFLQLAPLEVREVAAVRRPERPPVAASVPASG